MLVEVHQAQGHIHEAGVLVHEDHRASTQRRTGLLHLRHVEGQVDVLWQQHLHGPAARLERLEAAAGQHAAALFLEELTDWCSQEHLVGAGTIDVPAAAEEACSGAALRTQRFEPCTAPLHDVRQVAQRLHVVDDGRLAIQPLHRGEGRLQARLPTETLERIDERCLLAADVRAGATMHDHVTVEAAAEDVLADVAGGARLFHRLFQKEPLSQVLASDVDEGDVHLQRVRGDEDAFDQLMRALVHEMTILEASRLGLVRVATEVSWKDVLGQERPLRSGGKAGTAAPAHAARLDLLDERLRGELLEGLTQSLIPAETLVHRQGLQSLGAEILGEQLVLCHSSAESYRPARPPGRFCAEPARTRATIASTRSGVRFSSKRWSSCIAGAPPHAPRHSTVLLQVNSPSGVVPPDSQPSVRSR